MEDLEIYTEKHETTQTVEKATTLPQARGTKDIVSPKARLRLVVQTEIVFLLCPALPSSVGVENMEKRTVQR